jgi:hypothetical protein
MDWKIKMVLLRGMKNTDDAPRSTEKYRRRSLKDGGIGTVLHKEQKNTDFAPERTEKYRWCSS